MSFSDFVTVVPVPVRLLLCIVLVVGITLLCLKVFYPQIIELQREAKRDDDDESPEIPSTNNLAGRVITITTMAFVFLAAFALNNLWGAAKAADAAVQSETRAYYNAVLALQSVESAASRDAGLAALEIYRNEVATVQGPLLEQADSAGAYAAQLDAIVQLGDALGAARALDTAKSGAWDRAEDAVSDMTDFGEARVRALPGAGTVGILWLICILGLLNLGLLTAFQPTYFARNMFLIAMAALVTAVLMFAVVEVSNPYIGGGAVEAVIADLAAR